MKKHFDFIQLLDIDLDEGLDAGLDIGLDTGEIKHRCESTPSEFIHALELVEVSVLAQPVNLDGTVLEENVAFLVSLELPRLDKDNVAVANPQLALESARDAAVARFRIKATDHAARCAEALFEDSEHFRGTRHANAREQFLVRWLGTLVLGHRMDEPGDV